MRRGAEELMAIAACPRRLNSRRSRHLMRACIKPADSVWIAVFTVLLSLALRPAGGALPQQVVPDDRILSGEQQSSSVSSPRPVEVSDESRRPRVLGEPFAEPRQLLRLLDIDSQDWGSFVDGTAIGPQDEDTLLKILFRMPQIAPDDIRRWLQEPIPGDALHSAPTARRAEFFLLQGRARAAVRRELSPEQAALFLFDHYYEVHVRLADPPRDAWVYTRVVPRVWRGRTDLDERCQVHGLFLKVGDATAGNAPLLFAAPRVAWLPDRTSQELGIGTAQVLLGDHGMDVGLFDAVHARNGMPISSEERECFYALLGAASRMSEQQVRPYAAPLQLAALLQQPQEHHGDLALLRGSVKRITRVAIEEEDIRARYGLDHYYQLDLLMPLHGAEIRVRDEKDSEAGPTYQSSFPLTCCATSIPDGWQPWVGEEQISVDIMGAGFFLKLWAYSNPYVASFDGRQLQLSPLMVTPALSATSPPTASRGGAGALIGAIFLVILAGLWLLIYRLHRADRTYAIRMRQPRGTDDAAPDWERVEDARE